jgi:DNA repair exonuclease SbcCD ATPase subunit
MEKNQKSPESFQFLLENRKIIIEVIKESNSIPRAWEVIKIKLPKLPKLIKFNTFKGYVKTINVIDKIMENNENVNKEKENISKKLEMVRQEKNSINKELCNVRQELKVFKENQRTIIDENSRLGKINIGLDKELEKVRQEKDSAKRELGKVRQVVKDMEKDQLKTMNENTSLDITNERLDKVRQYSENSEDDDLYMASSLANPKKQELTDGLDKVRQDKTENNLPKRIDGWGVQLRGNYYRLFKKIKGKVKWIHVGREWNIEIVRSKIENFKG